MVINQKFGGGGHGHGLACGALTQTQIDAVVVVVDESMNKMDDLSSYLPISDSNGRRRFDEGLA